MGNFEFNHFKETVTETTVVYREKIQKFTRRKY